MQQRDMRLELNNRVEISWNGSKTLADIENISVGGALLLTKLPVQVGDLVSVHLEEESFPIAMNMSGKVIRKQHIRHGRPAFALKFGTIPGVLETFMHYLTLTHRATMV